MAQWHCSIKGAKYGPISEEELKQWIREGRLGTLDLVWREGMSEWMPATNVSELTDLFATQMPTGGAAPPLPGDSQPASGAPGVRPTMTRVKPHRGGVVLALGILSFVVCCICGIIAWSMGNSDLREMAAGRMDRSGEGLTQAGRICGMVSVILSLVGLGFYVLVLLISASASF